MIHKNRRSHSPFGSTRLFFFHPRILEVAPVCTHRLAVERLLLDLTLIVGDCSHTPE